MKLSFSTLPCKEWTIEKTLEICSTNNIDAIELRLGLNDWSDVNMSDEKIEYIKELLKKYDVKISDFGTQVTVKEYSKEQLDNLVAAAKLGQKFGVLGLRIMLGIYRVKRSDDLPESDYQGIIKWLKEACAIISEYNCEIWLETHNDFATCKILKQVIDEVNMENCKILWDIMHPLEVGESIDESIKYVEGHLAHVHIKDGMPWEDENLVNWKYTHTGEGIIPIKEIVSKLLDKGYDGYFSLEWESEWRAEIRGPEYTGEIVIPKYASYWDIAK